MKHTFHDRLCAGLEVKGWKRDLTDRSRYDAYFQSGKSDRLFVGPKGALRCGPCASLSFSVGDAVAPHNRFYADILKAGDDHLYILKHGRNEPVHDVETGNGPVVDVIALADKVENRERIVAEIERLEAKLASLQLKQALV